MEATLWDIPRARKTDPETSHIAAEKIVKSGRLSKQAAFVLSAVKRHPGGTAVELSKLTDGIYDRYVFSRRLPELERKGLIVRGPTRECFIGHAMMATWNPAPDGGSRAQGCARLEDHHV